MNLIRMLNCWSNGKDSLRNRWRHPPPRYQNRRPITAQRVTVIVCIETPCGCGAVCDPDGHAAPCEFQTLWRPEPSGLWPGPSPAGLRPSSWAAAWAGQRASPAGPPCAPWWSPQASPGTCWTPAHSLNHLLRNAVRFDWTFGQIRQIGVYSCRRMDTNTHLLSVVRSTARQAMQRETLG